MKRIPTYLLRLLVSAFLIVNALSCKDDDEEQSPTPSITNISPLEGQVGTPVTIFGENFSSEMSGNTVHLNGAEAIVTNVSSTKLVITVPVGASSGKITVTVNNKTATSSADFTVVMPAPTISSFSPIHGVPGAQITINGSNFDTAPNNNTVKFDGLSTTVISATATQLVVSVPADATSGVITVTVAGKDATSVNSFEVLKDIPREGLVAFYPFTGNANDASGNGLNGNVNGATLATDRFGKSNQSYSFDGANDEIFVGNPTALQINTRMTVAGWVNLKDYNTRSIISKIFFDPNAGGDPTSGYWILHESMGDGTPSLKNAVYSTTNLPISNFIGGNISVDTWIFFAMILDDNNWKFYQNGQFVEVGETATILDDGVKGDLVFGSYGGGFFFNGSIDDVAIYNRALSESEIQQLYEQTVSKY